MLTKFVWVDFFVLNFVVSLILPVSVVMFQIYFLKHSCQYQWVFLYFCFSTPRVMHV